MKKCLKILILLMIQSFMLFYITGNEIVSALPNFESSNSFILHGAIQSSIYGKPAPCGLYPSMGLTTHLYFPVVGLPPRLWELSGHWYMEVIHGNITDFAARFNMSNNEGIEPTHEHIISNFVSLDPNSGQLRLTSNEIITLNGTIDFKQTCHQVLKSIPVVIKIDVKDNIINIKLNSELIANHFGSSNDGSFFNDGSINGIIETVTENGNTKKVSSIPDIMQSYLN